MKRSCLVLLLLLLGPACKSRREEAPAPLAAEPAACTSATAAACTSATAASPTAATATGVDPVQSEVCTCTIKETHSDREVVPAAQAKVGDLTRCPVSGVVFRVSADSPQVEHVGKSWRVCCDGCAEKFREQPSRFSGG